MQRFHTGQRIRKCRLNIMDVLICLYVLPSLVGLTPLEQDFVNTQRLN